jgi:sulfide:quinone oxidoreductase
MLALRKLGEERVAVELLAPEPHFWYRPLAVAEPFAAARVHPIELVELAAECGAGLTLGALATVEPDAHRAWASNAAEFEYDALVVACGATPVAAVPGAFTFRGLADTTAFEALLADVEAGAIRRVVFAVPGGVTWPLPAYELALLTAERGHEEVELALVTPEDGPLSLFGLDASAAVTRLLADRGVSLYTGRYPTAFMNGVLELAPQGAIEADAVVALPRLHGVQIAGLPHDANGFVPTDLHARVKGIPDVFAAGDITTFPVKQGGVAAQQARAAAETIAAAAGANVEPKPFRPVLRSVLLTGTEPTYLRAELVSGRSEAAHEPLWWPPGKIVGRHLAPFLAEHADAVLHGADDS